MKIVDLKSSTSHQTSTAQNKPKPSLKTQSETKASIIHIIKSNYSCHNIKWEICYKQSTLAVFYFKPDSFES